MGLPNKKPQPPDTIPEAEVEVLEATGPPDSLSDAEVEILAAPRDLTAPAPSPHTGASGAKGSQPQPQSLPSQGSGSLTPPTGHPQPTAAGNNNPPPRPTPRPPIFAPNQSIEILPRGEAISPLPPPGMPAAPIPKGLQGPPSKTPPGEFPRFGPGQDLPTPGPLPGFQGVQPGLEKMARNFNRFSYGTSAAGLGGSPLQTTPTAPAQLDPDAWRPPDWRGRLGAAADVVEGFEEASGPYIIPALAAGAVAGGPAAATLIAGNVALGYGGEELTRRGMEAAGVDPRIAKFTSKVVGWGPVEKMPGYSHAITGAAEALIPNSPTKQFSEGLGKSVEEFNSLVDELKAMDPSKPGYGKLAQDLAQGEVQLGMAANTLAQANLLGAIKSAQIMGKLRKVPQAESMAWPPGVDMAPAPGLDTSIPAPDIIPAEPPATPYKSGIIQYNLPDDLAARVQFMGEQIPEESLAPQGRESQPHLTIRYGLGEDPQTSLPKIRQALADQGPITVTLGETTLFPDRGDGEVVKIDLAQSPELEAIRAKLAQAGIEHIPDIGDTEGYSPHITVAFVKPGEGQKYTGPSPLTGQELVIDRIWLGDRQGNQYEVPFGKSMEGILGPEAEAIRPILGESEYHGGADVPKFSIHTPINSRNSWYHATTPQAALGILESGMIRGRGDISQPAPGVSTSRIPGSYKASGATVHFVLDPDKTPAGRPLAGASYKKTLRPAKYISKETLFSRISPEEYETLVAKSKQSDALENPDIYEDYLEQLKAKYTTEGRMNPGYEFENRVPGDIPLSAVKGVLITDAPGMDVGVLRERFEAAGIPARIVRREDLPSYRARMAQDGVEYHVTQSGQPGQTQPQLWTPEQLSKSLPGYKMDLLPNDERTNPGGATLGLETPSGKWAKLVVTKGRDLPASPADMAKQLGRPAQPGDVVMGQYESRGLREQSVITLAGAAGPETLDHELFHYAFDTFLTPQEQAAILAAHGSEEAAAIAYGQGKGGLDPGLSRLKKLFSEIHNKFYPDSKATIESLRKGQIWERQARYGVDTREPVYRKPDGSLDWSLESMGKSFLETFDRNLVRFESNEPVYLAAALAAPGTAQSISREALIGPAQEIARIMHAGGYGQGSLQKGWVAFAEVLIDNRLAGVQGRWSDLANAVEKATQKELRKGLARNSEGPDGALIRVLDRIDADQPMANGNSRAAKAREFLANKDFAGAKLYLGSIFRHNAYAVKRLDLKTTHGKTLQEFAQDPQFQQALQVYKSKVEALMAKHHLKNEGMLSVDLGPLDTYYPLVPQELGDMPVWQQSARERGYWIRPHNPSNYFTTGLATKGYDPELSTFRSRLTAAIRGGNTKQFMDVLIGTGLAVKVTDRSTATAVFRGGEELPVDVIPLGSAQSISVKGQALKVPPQYVAVPKALGPTIRSVVLGEGPGGSSAFHSESFVEDVVNRISGWSLVGPADAAFHAQAVLSSLVAGTPYLRQSNTFLTVMANLPIAKSFTAMYTTFRRPAEYFVSDEGAKKLLHIAQIGAANPRIGSVAWDKDFADLFGAEWKPPLTDRSAWRRTPEERADADAAQFSQAQGIKAKAKVLGRKLASYMDVAGRIGDLGTSALVFGHPGEAAGSVGSGAPSWIRNHMIGLDLRARVALYDTHRALFPDAPQADLANFINQAMQYNWGLQSHFEQYIKGYAGTRLTSVFFTAGYSMIRAGVRAMNPIGTTHGLNRLDPIGRQQIFRAQRAFSGGVTGMTTAWALLNFAASGGRHWPWDQDQPDGPVPVGYIRLPQDIRESTPGKVLMGDPAKGSPRQGYVPMGFFNPPVWKGSTALGIRPAADTAMLLGSEMGIADPVGRQLIALEAMRGSMNTFLHPLLSGPIPRAGLAALGMSPWIGPMWDPLTGRNQFTLRTESRAAPGIFSGLGMAAARAAGQMSPTVNWLNEAGMEAGLGQPLSGKTLRDDGAAWAKTLADLIVPRSRPIGMDIRKKAEQARELVVKRKRLLQKQAGGQ